MPAPEAFDRLMLNQPASVQRWIDWLRIPSISTDPKYRDDCRRAAQWCCDQLGELGFSARLVESGEIGSDGRGGGHPIVLATIEPKAGYKGPHVLFYGHYDVQPVDPLNLWESDPFQPVLRDAKAGETGGRRIVARGAVDDKGQVMTFLEACRACKQVSGHATNGAAYTVVIEGEEESGSVNLPKFVKDHAATLRECDVCLISDTGMLGRDKPAITYGVRGLAYTEVTLHAANQDLHSGLWGGRCPNPITELARVLAQLHDAKRRVTIPGFYKDVVPLTKAERANWKALKFNSVAALKKIGLGKDADIGEAGYTAMEREWGRPTAEINGIWGGYTGPGAKTVIPAHASAKVSFRLVADQDPRKITKMFFKWCKDHTPPGCRWELNDHHGGFGVTTPIDSPAMQAAQRALKLASGRKVSLIKSGGSIPVAGLLKDVLKIDTIFMGFGLDDDRVHSPNEKFELACFELGCRAHAAFVGELAAM
ncbi:MAG: M20/M25/M40 family metallo-hydrolase [Planctomycetota bacterium]|nr:M20/M25/M40 family metallo-hydrolase [Planctomycetota bacterium]